MHAMSKPTLHPHPAAFTLYVEKDENCDGLSAEYPLHMLTMGLLDSYKEICPTLDYRPTKVPRRCLTNPSAPCHNEGSDNENFDLILRVGDTLVADTWYFIFFIFNSSKIVCGWCNNDNTIGNKYRVIDSLGQGTFGQVVKCRSEKDGKLVAIKVLKNKSAYFKQGLYEISILFLLNKFIDPDGSRNTLRLTDHFLFHNHLCIVNELLSINLFELIKQNKFRGLSIKLIQKFITQLLDAMIGLEEFEIIHCDLKPENILLENLKSSKIRLIDFGSACMEHAPQYSYIQSRHYRAPEVLLGLQYTTAIDMWSVGCITAELLLGIPLFPGANEYNQMFKISEMLEAFPPPEMIEKGSRAPRMFKKGPVVNGRQQYVFKTEFEYQRDNGTRINPDKQYFSYRTLREIINKVSIRASSSSVLEIRKSLEHFLRGLLNLDPSKRWTARIAREHPFLREGNEALDPANPFPSRELLERINRERNGKLPRACNPPIPFQKILTRENLFPQTVMRPNGSVNYFKAYLMFVDALRNDRVIDIANGKDICPVLVEKQQAAFKEDIEIEEEDDDDFSKRMDIVMDDTVDNRKDVAGSFSETHVLPTGGGGYPSMPLNISSSSGSGPGLSTSVGGGLFFGNMQPSVNYNNSSMNMPNIQVGNSYYENSLSYPQGMNSGGAAPVNAPSVNNNRYCK